MAAPSLQKMRLYLHLVPVFGIVLSLWTLYSEPLYGKGGSQPEEIEQNQQRTVSRLSVTLGLTCICAIALLGAGAHTQASQMASLRFLLASSFVGSGYFLLSLGLMFQIAKGRSVRLPVVSQISRRLP